MTAKLLVRFSFWSLLFSTFVFSREPARADHPPLVSVVATDPHAAEEGLDPATFAVLRTSGFGEPLTVYYQLSGTAGNGTDYEILSGKVVIPAGHAVAPVEVRPIDDDLIEGRESVVLTLVEPPGVVDYFVCWPAAAVAWIADNDTVGNHPPRIKIVSPPDQAVFLAPADVTILARASDRDGRVRSVEFFAGDESLGVIPNPALQLSADAMIEAQFDVAAEISPLLYPEAGVSLEGEADFDLTIHGQLFRLTWTNVPPGEHVLTALATDDDGDETWSDPVHIRVTEPPMQPVVNVYATDPVASEVHPDEGLPPDVAVFTVRRSGNTDIPLDVFYRLSGTASNGVDYLELPTRLTIPAGWRSAEIVVEPIDDDLVEGRESVIVTLEPPVCIEIWPPPPDCYLVGRHYRARAVILDNDTPPNQPPAVRILRPLDGQVFLAPADIRIVAGAHDFDGRIHTVEFFAADRSLGIVTNSIASLDPLKPAYSLTWEDVEPGHYVLTAEATDNEGASTLSKPVEIRVVDIHLPNVVTVVATDPVATEGGFMADDQLPIDSIVGDIAVFKVSRTGSTEHELEVYYEVGGTAENGVDYVELPGRVIIPKGESSTRILVYPIDDLECEGTESVVLELKPVACIAIYPPPPGCYVVGVPGRAKAVIHDDGDCEGNQPPRVAIASPEDGDVFVAPADIKACAEAGDPEGRVVQVEFFANGESIGIVQGDTAADALNLLYCIEWENVEAGTYKLVAVATDDEGLPGESEPVEIRVIHDTFIPTVTIRARDAHATEGGISFGLEGEPVVLDTARFEVARNGRTNVALTVYYSLSGTAENGVDYEKLSGEVVIPEGAWSAGIEVVPLDDNLVEGTETVVASLEPIACARIVPPPPECYLVGDPRRAIAYIHDNDTHPDPGPKVALISPPDGSVFPAFQDIRLIASAKDPDGWVRSVEFFAGDRSLGIVSNRWWLAEPHPLDEALHEGPLDPWIRPLYPFALTWSNVPPGSYELTAVATDNDGNSNRSAPARIEVIDFPSRPVVTVVATDPKASERGGSNTDSVPDYAVFEVRRTGDVSEPLDVRYRLGGSAENGVDYVELPLTVTIPEGRAFVEILIEPIDDDLVEGTEDVIIRILPPLCIDIFPPPPGCYLVGRQYQARAFIEDNDGPGNQPPFARMVLPQNGQVFLEGQSIQLLATARDFDGEVTGVEFFEGENSLGEAAGPFRPLEIAEELPSLLAEFPEDFWQGSWPLYSLVWSNVPAGRYVLTARATDDDGDTGASRPVEIKVVHEHLPTVVTIEAVDERATEPNPFTDGLPDTASFAVHRTGPTTEALAVFYRVGGTATNGDDYVELSGEVIFPEGSSSAEILVDPLHDDLVEGDETVVVELIPPVCLPIFPPPSACYVVGHPGRAKVVIQDDDVHQNVPPEVAILKPHDGRVFTAPADIRVVIGARDPDGWVAGMELFANGEKIDEQAIHFVQPPPPGLEQEFEFEWKDVPAGTYELTARATDELGAWTVSAAVRIKVRDEPVRPEVWIVTVDPFAREGTENTAAFRVFRGGSTERDLRVYFEAGGTATPEEDYTLSEAPYVMIPAGRHSTRLVVEALEDNEPEGIESVVISLVLPPDSNALSDAYVLGSPDQAAAVILDNDQERPGVICLPDGLFHLRLPGTAGMAYRIEASANLNDWVVIGTTVAAGGQVEFIDPEPAEQGRRFYRAVPDPDSATLE